MIVEANTPFNSCSFPLVASGLVVFVGRSDLSWLGQAEGGIRV